MSKSILVFDTPKNCADCMFENHTFNPITNEFKLFCQISGDVLWTKNIKKVNCSCPLKPLGRKVEEYGLETWNTRDGTFLCEKGLFDKLYGKGDENE